MKGFIEVHTANNNEVGAINVKYIKIFTDYTIIPHGSYAIEVKETYEEIKQLIENAEGE